MAKKETILLVKNRALGDSIMGLSAVQYLKQIHPQSNIIYAVPQWIAPLYSEAITAADAIYSIKLKNIVDIIALYRDLSRLKIQHIHEMHQTGRGAKIFKIISFLMGIKYTAHNHHLKHDTGVIDQGKILPLIQRDLDGIFSFFGGKLRPSYLNFTPQLKPIKTGEKLPVIIFGVVATRSTKMWPLENFVKLANLILEQYPMYSIIIPLSKSPADQNIKALLKMQDIPSNTAFVEWNLNNLPQEFYKAAVYIGNDTGLKHLAVAVGIKTYTFFGPEPWSEWHPYNTDAHPYFYLENLACRTRTHHYCGLSVCDLSEDNMHCLKHFSPEEVLTHLHIF